MIHRPALMFHTRTFQRQHDIPKASWEIPNTPYYADCEYSVNSYIFFCTDWTTAVDYNSL